MNNGANTIILLSSISTRKDLEAWLNLSIPLILAQVSSSKKEPVKSRSLQRWTGWPMGMGGITTRTRMYRRWHRQLSWWCMFLVRLEWLWLFVGWLFGWCWSILKCKKFSFFFSRFYYFLLIQPPFKLRRNIFGSIFTLPNFCCIYFFFWHWK